MADNYSLISQFPDELVIFDLDGCLSDDSWRLAMIHPEGHHDRYGKYHDHLGDDRAIVHSVELLQIASKQGKGILFITARPGRVLRATSDWLIRQFLRCGFVSYLLFMRQECEEGIDSVTLKAAILQRIRHSLRSSQKITHAYDDRQDVVDMYISEGIASAMVLDVNGLHPPGPKSKVVGEPTSEREWPMNAADALLMDAICELPNQNQNAGDILEAAGKTFRERNAVYKDNASKVGQVMAVLFPNGVQLKTAEDHKMYHLFELIIVKLTRFTNSGLQHQDSVHDLAVYAAMCEVLVGTHSINFEGNK